MPLRRMGRWCIEPHFLDLDTSWRWVVTSRPGPFYPRGGWVGPRTRLDDVEKTKFLTLPGLELRPPLSSRSVASRNTDCAIPAHVNIKDVQKMLALIFWKLVIFFRKSLINKQSVVLNYIWYKSKYTRKSESTIYASNYSKVLLKLTIVKVFHIIVSINMPKHHKWP
jgi:hypothetical protein